MSIVLHHIRGWGETLFTTRLNDGMKSSSGNLGITTYSDAINLYDLVTSFTRSYDLVTSCTRYYVILTFVSSRTYYGELVIAT